MVLRQLCHGLNGFSMMVGNKDTTWLIWGRLDIPHSAIFYLPESLSPSKHSPSTS